MGVKKLCDVINEQYLANFFQLFDKNQYALLII